MKPDPNGETIADGAAVLYTGNGETKQTLKHIDSRMAQMVALSKKSWKDYIPAFALLVVILGMGAGLVRWKEKTEIELNGLNKNFVNYANSVNTKLNKMCNDASDESNKVWNRFERDKDDRQVIRNNMTQQGFDIQVIDTKVNTLQIEQKEIGSDVKKILTKMNGG